MWQQQLQLKMMFRLYRKHYLQKQLYFRFALWFLVVTVIEVVPAPAVIVHPVGTVQLYVVALATAEMLYVWLTTEGHCVTVPVIAPGVAGVGLIVTVALPYVQHPPLSEP